MVRHIASRASHVEADRRLVEEEQRGRPQTAIANCTWRFWPPDSLP